MKGLITKSTGKWYDVKINNKIYKTILRGKLKIDNQLTNPIASGDYVELIKNNDKDVIINNIHKRRNCIIRKSNRNDKGHIMASNIDQLLILCSIKEPYTKISFIDRCLVSANYYNIRPIIVFNKLDILNKNELENLNIILKNYLTIGFDSFMISAKYNININDLLKILKKNKTLVIGNSGVGKSTLINLLCNKSKQKTNPISKKTKKGKQTTTFSEMFEINENSFLIDTPGFKEFQFYGIEKNEIKYTFPEFNKLRDKCKFNNCNHEKEPNCNVKKNIDKTIWRKRYTSYLTIINSL